jgi:hypothetical protein
MNIYKNPKAALYFPTRLFHIGSDEGKLNGEARIVTEEGEVLGFNWVNGMDRSLTGRQNPAVTLKQQFLYHTPVSFVPSPFIPGLFLACDRSQIVLADLKQGVQELFRSSARTAGLTCVAFSPTRPSLFLAGKDNGEVEIWAILDKSHECLFTQSVASSRVVSLSFGVGHNEKQLLAVGCGDGSLMIYKVPEFMSRAGNEEAEQMRKFVEQQRAFVLQTDDRFKVRAAEARQKEADARNTRKTDSEEKTQEEEDFDEDKVDIELVQFEREYTRILKEFEAIEAKNTD